MPAEEKKETKPQKKSLVNRYWWSVLVVIAIAAVAAGGYYFLQYQKEQMLLKSPTLSAQLQTADIVNRVGQLMVLPTNETPQIATVSDVTKLAGQPFFAKAKDGFKVLIYTSAKEAILYDPFSNKIVSVTSVYVAVPTPTSVVTSPTPTPTKRPVRKLN